MIIDVGSNTIKNSIYESQPDGSVHETKSRSLLVQLIKYVHDGVLSEQGLEVLCESLTSFKEKADKFECTHIYCFATAALRRLNDPTQVFEQVRERTGIEIQLLSGDEEAELSWLTLQARGEGKATTGLLIDIGGGSTELTKFTERTVTHRVSLPFGALSLYESHVAAGEHEFPNEKQKKAIRQTVADMISAENLDGCGENIYLLGGSTKAVGTLMRLMQEHDIKSLHKLSYKNNIRKTDAFRFNQVYTFQRSQFKYVCGKFEKLSARKTKIFRNIFPRRYMLVMPAFAALDVIFEAAGAEHIHVIPGGIRDGFICKLHDKILNIVNPKSI